MTKKILIFITILLVVSVSAYFWDKQNTQTTPNTVYGWKEYKNEVGTYRYPSDLGTTYIKTVDWPPLLSVLDERFECSEAGMEFARAGISERHIVDDTEYCVTRVSEGAAGSTYTSYAYAFSKDEKMAILTFSLKSVQCQNYDEPKAGECKSEGENLNLSQTIHNIAKTIDLK